MLTLLVPIQKSQLFRAIFFFKYSANAKKLVVGWVTIPATCTVTKVNKSGELKYLNTVSIQIQGTQ